MVLAIYGPTPAAQWIMAVSSIVAAAYVIHFMNSIIKRNRRKDAEDKYLRFQVNAMVHAHKKQENGAGKLFSKNYDDMMEELTTKDKKIKNLIEE